MIFFPFVSWMPSVIFSTKVFVSFILVFLFILKNSGANILAFPYITKESVCFLSFFLYFLVAFMIGNFFVRLFLSVKQTVRISA